MRKQRGFKLLEMMIVMAIICILMAFYLPALVSAKRKAQGTADMVSSPQRFVNAAPEEFTGYDSTGGEGGGTTGGPPGDLSNKGNTKGKTRQIRSAISPQ